MREERLYKSGEICQMLGITRETLRHYRNTELVNAAEVSENGYHLFDERAMLNLMLIRFYRSYDILLPEVKRFIQDADLREQTDILGEAMAIIDDRIRELEALKDALARRIRIMEESHVTPPLVQYDPHGREMFLLNIRDALSSRKADGIAAIRAMAALFPRAHISLVGGLDDLLARRPMPCKLGFGVIGEIPASVPHHGLFQRIPGESCVFARIKVKNPLCIQPDEIAPLRDAVTRNRLTPRDGVFGHIVSAQQDDFSITMRIHTEAGEWKAAALDIPVMPRR